MCLETLRCGTWTAECARNYLLHNNTAKVPQAGSVGQRDPLLTVVKDGLEKGMSALPADWEATGFFPEAKQGALGTCAVVATGDNLMQSPLRGEEIDAHDTVIRYNSPMKGYEQGVRRVLCLRPLWMGIWLCCADDARGGAG